MPYTEDNGLLNNFAKEPKMYTAQPMNSSEKRNSLVLVILGSVLVIGLISVAFFATQIS
ncbi:photosystem II assembly protein Psb34 [[Phormidium] sp. ETS-05]|uniref:photosystem II assembly protein Psb34 n=1 Tax=[Phormidium] sp. ETS-05 TaxID=222819 RepID=UPI0018EF2F71|nr:ssl1498 family light-harvesting-like protein [[Phormidium] sp. ETS-05]